MNYRTVECSDRLPDKSWFGIFILRSDEEDEYGWGDYWGLTANLNLGYTCIWLEPYELPTEGEIELLVYGLYEDSPIALVLSEDEFKKYYADYLIKAITNLLKGESNDTK